MVRLAWTGLACVVLGTACSDGKTGKPDGPRSRDGMVYVPAGEFPMSSGSADDNRRKVWVDAFYIDLHEVSNADWARFIAAGGYSNRAWWTPEGWTWRDKEQVWMPRWWLTGRYNIGTAYLDYPIAGVSWYEASAYAKWAGKRLPTEAEWEKASRGTDGRRYPWGGGEIASEGVYHANFESYQDGFLYSAPVKSFPQGKGPYGCFNMLGNVWEWVSDWYPDAEWYKSAPPRNPAGPPTGTRRLLRGGSWFKDPSYYESFFRFGALPESRRYDDVGFRCALSAN